MKKWNVSWNSMRKYENSLVWKECRLFLWCVNCFCPFLQLKVEDFLIFLSAWALFWLFWPEEGRFLTFFAERNAAGMSEAKKVKKRPSEGQKTQKRPKADKKIKKSETWSCKKGQKQLTNRKSLHSFHTWLVFIFTHGIPWILFFFN